MKRAIVPYEDGIECIFVFGRTVLKIVSSAYQAVKLVCLGNIHSWAYFLFFFCSVDFFRLVYKKAHCLRICDIYTGAH